MNFMLSEKFWGMEVIDDKQDFSYPLCQKLVKKKRKIICLRWN